MPQAKKKATAKAVKPESSVARKAPAVGAAGRKAASSVVQKTVVGKTPQSKKAPSKKALGKKAPGKKSVDNNPTGKKAVGKKRSTNKSSTTLKATAVGKKTTPAKSVDKKPIAQPAVVSKPVNQAAAGKMPVVKTLSKRPKTAPTKEEKTINKSKPGSVAPEPVKTGSSAVVPHSKVSETKPAIPKATSNSRSKVRAKKQDTGLSDSISQGLGKQPQKKRGWRDIEALTERARLKSLLSDIWHEDIDLDSDIFGETDHLFGYYTDKEEVVEVEPEENEEWEEFEEDED